jgi:ABC-2 type transport system permease protein
MSALSHVATDSSAMIWRSLRRTSRDLESLMMAVLLPVILMLLFVYVFGGAIRTGTAYVNYVVPGILLLCAGFGSSGTAVSVCTDMVNGIVDRFRSMRIVSSAMLTGHVVASLARNLVAMTLVVAVAFAVGWRPTAGPVQWLGAAGLTALFILAFSWLSAALGLLAKSPETASGFTFLILFLPYVSSAFVPVDTMPSFLRGFASHQPVTPVIETLRGLLMGGPVGATAWVALAWCVGIGAASWLAATVLFHRR